LLSLSSDPNVRATGIKKGSLIVYTSNKPTKKELETMGWEGFSVEWKRMGKLTVSG